MEHYLIDTNIVSKYFSASFSETAMQLLDKAFDAIPNLSVITQIELLCWKIGDDIEQNVRDFINDSVVLDISPEVIENCVSIRKGKKIKTPDAIIAATALAHSFTLISNNEKDFSNIRGLTVINPEKL